jgi:glyoxylate reductase
MSPWGMNTIYFNRTPLSKAKEEELGVRYVSLSEIWAKSDVISVHCPLTPETRHVVNANTLSQCKKGVFIVNTSRGPVIDEAALVQALKEGHVGGAGLDVFEREPRVEENLLKMDNVVLSPHFAAFTHECSTPFLLCC